MKEEVLKGFHQQDVCTIELLSDIAILQSIEFFI